LKYSRNNLVHVYLIHLKDQFEALLLFMHIIILRTRMFGQRQAIGILGIIFAVTGGIAWFFQQTIFAVMLWGVAGIILLKLNRKSRIRSRR